MKKQNSDTKSILYSKGTGHRAQAITLISLIITIIILIILAGITISLTIGENGILSRARYAKEKYLNEQDSDEKRINELYSQILIATDDDSKITISVEDLRTLITEQVKETLKKENSVPAGTVISYMGNTAPTGYLFCDGTEYNISDYPNLAEQIKNEFGSYNYYGGDGITTFAVPDLRGEFLRGTGTNLHTNQGNGLKVGEHQDATNHRLFSINSDGALVFQKTNDNYDTYGWSTNHDSRLNFDKVTGYSWINKDDGDNTNDFATHYTSRPTNTSVLYCIKY